LEIEIENDRKRTQMPRHQRVSRNGRLVSRTLMTSAENRSAIESALALRKLDSLAFCYVDLALFLRVLQRWQGAIQLFAYLWQWRAAGAAWRLHTQRKFQLFHHLTYENDWMGTPIGALLPIPYVRGPCGGAHRIPQSFAQSYPLCGRLFEACRRVGQRLCRHDPVFLLSQQRAARIIVENQESLDALPRRWRDKSEILSINGVAREDFQIARRPALAAQQRFRVPSAGRPVRIKSFDLAIRAFRNFVDQCSAAEREQVRLEIIGRGPEGDRLCRVAAGVGVRGYVRICDWMARDDLLREMASSEVFLFPSVRDGGGLLVVEAMAAGLPVVCLDLGGPGLHVPPHRPRPRPVVRGIRPGCL